MGEAFSTSTVDNIVETHAVKITVNRRNCAAAQAETHKFMVGFCRHFTQFPCLIKRESTLAELSAVLSGM